MAKKPTLLILAAGMATRYGSLKQIDCFGPCGETIIDYSIYDAIKAGFGKVIFVIRESIEEAFKKAMHDKVASKIEVDYISQELVKLPEGFAVPENREKPWGTAHAVWLAASKIEEPFAVINSDDFYGYQSFKLIADFLRKQSNSPLYGLVGYWLNNTLSEHGAVSRGICEVDSYGNLKSVAEHVHIAIKEKGIVSRDTDNDEIFLTGNEIVSMNLMGFTPSVFPHFETYFKEFLTREATKNIKAEFYLPEVVNRLVQSDEYKVKVLISTEKWFGVTFPEDKPVAVQKLKELVSIGAYPENLWAHVPSIEKDEN